MDKDGSVQFKLQPRGTMCPVLPDRQKGTKWRQRCLKCQHGHISDVKVGCATSWCNSHPCVWFLTIYFVAVCSAWQSKKLSLVQAHKPSIHFSWETVLFSVMGYYNHLAWKAMYDSSFPTPFPLPEPRLSHSSGSRNTECKHFFPTRGNAMVSGRRGFTVFKMYSIFCFISWWNN